MSAPLLPKWRLLEHSNATVPRPRHGHRSVAIKDMILILSGGNEGIVEEIYVYKTSTNQWCAPQMKGEFPPGCAAYGLTCDDTRVFLFGGMLEYGKYSSDLHEMKINTWDWKKIHPRIPKSGHAPPRARLGHTFTLVGNKIYLFGGLANDSDDPKQNLPKYLNDLYILELAKSNSNYHWELPIISGTPPTPRESHSAVSFTPKSGGGPKLLIYGGMCGHRLGDIWILDINQMDWSHPEIFGVPPLPRSLHSATVIKEKMYIFGGWVPMAFENHKTSHMIMDKEWKVTNSLASFNLDTMTWEFVTQQTNEKSIPCPRAGHSATAMDSRLYIWSGRDGYRRTLTNQVCCSDLWYLETEKPSAPSRPQMSKATTSSLDITWSQVPLAESYIVQIQIIDDPAPPVPLPNWHSLVPESESKPANRATSRSALHPSVYQPTIESPTVPTVSSTSVTNGNFSSASPNTPKKLVSIANLQSNSTTSPIVSFATSGQMPGTTSFVVATQKNSTPSAQVRATSANQNIQIISPQNVQMLQSSATSMKLAPGTSQPAIRYFTQQQIDNLPNNKQIINIKTGQTPGQFTLVKPQQLSTYAKSGPQMVRILSPNQIKSSGANILSGTSAVTVQSTGFTTMGSMTSTTLSSSISSTSQKSISIPGSQLISTPQGMKMLVVQPSSRVPTSNITSGQKTYRFASLKSTGAQKLVLSQPLRILNTATGTHGQRVVIVPSSGQAITTSLNTANISAMSTGNTPTMSLQVNKPSSIGDSPTKIPQTDGPDDEIPYLSATTSSGQNGTFISPSTSSFIIEKPTTTLPAQMLSDDPEPQSQTAISNCQPSFSSTDISNRKLDSSISNNSNGSSEITISNFFVDSSNNNNLISPLKDTWYDVGVFDALTLQCAITSFYLPFTDCNYDPERDLCSDSPPLYEKFKKCNIESGTFYRVRVAGINLCGRGPWSEVSSFKTCFPGFPPAPINVRIGKASDGIQIFWGNPISNVALITEYSVYLGCKSSDPNQLIQYKKVYCKNETQCILPSHILSEAYIDKSAKPAIVFRIAAKNDMGYGPATHVRWLQDNLVSKRPAVAKNDVTSNKKAKS